MLDPALKLVMVVDRLRKLWMMPCQRTKFIQGSGEDDTLALIMANEKAKQQERCGNVRMLFVPDFMFGFKLQLWVFNKGPELAFCGNGLPLM